MTVVQIKKNSEEKEVALKAPHASSKWSHAGSDDMVFNKAGEKDRLMSGVLDSPSRTDDIHDRLDSNGWIRDYFKDYSGRSRQQTNNSKSFTSDK